MAWNFPNANDRLSNASARVTEDNGTIAFWFKPSWSSGDSVNHVWFNFGDASNYWPGGQKYSDNIVYLGFQGSPGDFRVQEADTGEFTAGAWHHIMLTYAAAASFPTKNAIYFVNNVEIDSRVSSPFNPVTQVNIPGVLIGNGTGLGIPASGIITEWGRWDRVLDATERDHLYTDKWAASLIPSGLAQYYEMTANASPEPDLGPSGWDLTVTNAAYSSDDPGIVYTAAQVGRIFRSPIFGG